MNEDGLIECRASVRDKRINTIHFFRKKNSNDHVGCVPVPFGSSSGSSAAVARPKAITQNFIIHELAHGSAHRASIADDVQGLEAGLEEFEANENGVDATYKCRLRHEKSAKTRVTSVNKALRHLSGRFAA